MRCSSCHALRLHLLSTRRKTNTPLVPGLHFLGASTAFRKQLIGSNTNDATFCRSRVCLLFANCFVKTTAHVKTFFPAGVPSASGCTIHRKKNQNNCDLDLTLRQSYF